MICAVGIHPDFVALLIDINKNMVRHIKIGGRYGDPQGQANGLGQGDPSSVLIALIYVGLQMRAVAKRFAVTLTAVLDDRTARGRPADVLKAIAFIMLFDKCAGQTTNARKLAALATTAGASEEVARTLFDGTAIAVRTKECVGRRRSHHRGFKGHLAAVKS